MKSAKNSRADRIRRLIKSSSIQCMTAIELSRLLDVSVPLIHQELKKMADVYIADWRKHPGGISWHALYACAHVPEDAPRPDTEIAKKSRSCAAPKSVYADRPRTVWVTL